MDEKTFKERTAKLTEVNSVISKLDPSIRAEAFSMLKDYVFGAKKGAHASEAEDPEDDKEAPQDKENFFKALDDKKPSDNALAVAAYYFSQHGQAALPVQILKGIADDVGFTVPGRLDMTLAAAQKGGKKFFKRSGRGAFTPTVHGATFFKDTYHVKPGKKPAPTPKADK